ncbi:YqaJ viral recombinase family protein [Vibrio phage vB_VpP_1]|nr:YqaJ viral recombinase family protein [Vibrio phage vB_VpP_1]
MIKTLQQHLDDLAKLDHVFGFNPAEVLQGSEEWKMMRLGVVTASMAECLVSKKPRSKGKEYGVDFLPAKAGDSKRDTFMKKLVAQVCTRQIPPEVTAKALAWGKDNEPFARDAYSAATFNVIDELPFIYKDSSMRFGISPDGLVGDDGGLELKCPHDSSVFVAFMCDDEIKNEYLHQCQFSMWVTGREYWDFANFDPRMKGGAKKLHYLRQERDPKAMELFDISSELFIADMNKMLKKAGVSFGDQWKPVD